MLQPILCRHFLPPRVTKAEEPGSATPNYADFGPIRRCALSTLHADLGADPVSARIPLPGHRDALPGAARPTRSAVMLDTFNPLQPTQQAVALEKTYMETWMEGDGE